MMCGSAFEILGLLYVLLGYRGVSWMAAWRVYVGQLRGCIIWLLSRCSVD